MTRRLLQFLCLIAALSVSGAHLGLGQAVAWAAMLLDEAGREGVVVALKHTFDGEHPCKRCCKVREHSQNDLKDPARTVTKEVTSLGADPERPRFIFRPDFTLLHARPDPRHAALEGFPGEVFQPPERA